jgi:hypothetical protein
MRVAEHVHHLDEWEDAIQKKQSVIMGIGFRIRSDGRIL